jgi:ectoine hydroxylase-related dioxygenase (phytanoyl-CoA dioxygenase family)
VAALTADQLAQYEEDGYLVLPALFSDEEVAEMAAEADRLAAYQVAVSLTLGTTSPRLDVQRRDGQVVLRKIQPVNDISPTFTKFSEDERLVRPLSDILGCAPVLMEEKLNYKQVLPGNPSVVTGDDPDESFPFHTDIAYFWLDGYPMSTLSSAITIDETTIDNGPIVVVPGSHKRKWPHQEGWPPVLAPGAVREDETVAVLAPPGSVMIFHSALVHASSANRTATPRRLMILSHHPETHEVEPDKRNRHLRLAAHEAEQRYEETPLEGRARYSLV